jgi:hypothetical protein
MIVDAYRAFDLLPKHPRIDPAHIALMGFSRDWGSSAATQSMDSKLGMIHPPGPADEVRQRARALGLNNLEACRAVGNHTSALEGTVLHNPVNDRASVLQ